MKPFKIGSHSIGPGEKPFVIAELSGNHNQSIEKALNLIDLAADAGAHAVKLQTYTADSLTIDCHEPDFVINDSKSLWNGRNLYELYQEACTPYEWHERLFKKCHERGVLCFSTPFDEGAVDFLEQFNPPCYKIASFENNHYPLIKKVISKKKPIIISLGLCTEQDILDLKNFMDREGAQEYVFLKCTSTYPASPSATNLMTIPYLKSKLGINIGLSDHTLGIGVSVAAVALGAQVIEKHFTDSRAKGGVDSAFSMEPEELKSLVVETERAWLGLGKVSFELTAGETNSLQFKRSIYVVEDIPAGGIITENNIRIIRPGKGLHPKYYSEVLGRKVKQSLKRGQALGMDLIDQ
jgi:pseudaminic acid synthase